ncbi:MAG: YeeE/YedE thiosulfate transporter family protein [Myxococcota bacterium]
MAEFTPGSATMGGILIGAGAALLWLFNGRVAGISGITGGLLPSVERSGNDGRAWRVAFVAGLVGVGAVAAAWVPSAFASSLELSPSVLAVAGLAVGVGTQLGGGCTSGHGVCGLGRFSFRSLVAVLTFMTTGAMTVWLVRVTAGAGVGP